MTASGSFIVFYFSLCKLCKSAYLLLSLFAFAVLLRPLSLASVCLFLTACSVTFDNTPVPVENVVGVVGNGFKVSS